MSGYGYPEIATKKKPNFVNISLKTKIFPKYFSMWIQGPGTIDSWKKPEVKNLMLQSLLDLWQPSMVWQWTPQCMYDTKRDRNCAVYDTPPSPNSAVYHKAPMYRKGIFSANEGKGREMPKGSMGIKSSHLLNISLYQSVGECLLHLRDKRQAAVLGQCSICPQLRGRQPCWASAPVVG